MPNSAPSWFQQLRHAATPFVSRTFRGNRRRRYTAGALLLGVLSVVLGMWMTAGTGDFPRDVRRGLNLEQGTWQQDRAAFTITVHDPFEQRMLEEEHRSLRKGDDHLAYSALDAQREGAYATLYTALSHGVPAAYADLGRDVETLLERLPPTTPDPQWHYAQDNRDWQFDWYAPAERQRLRSIIDRKLLPDVVLYSSPLGWTDGVRLTGAIAGGFMIVLMLIAAPLSAGATLAQEVHENTLQPVLGTRMRPGEIVVGLAASGLGLAGWLAAPSALVFGAAAVFSHSLAHVVVFSVLLLASSVFITMLTLLAGFSLGRRWSSGIVGTLLTVALCSVTMLAVALGMNLDDEMTGLIAMFPQAGVVHALREMFAPGTRLTTSEVMHAVFVSCGATVGLSILAGVLARALTRRIEGRTQVSLTRAEGFVAATTTTMLALTVVPELGRGDAVVAYFLSLAMAALPWQLILAGRVTVGDGPSTLRTVPLRMVMLELLGFLSVHAVLLVLTFGLDALPASLLSLFHLQWAFTVLGLLAVRLVAVPLSIPGNLFAMVCFGAICFELMSAAMFGSEPWPMHGHQPAPLLMFEAGAFLGVVQLALLVAIPWSLLHTLKKGSAGLR